MGDEKSMIDRTVKHYKVDELLGKGGMGVVYRAQDLKLKRPVALKMLKADLTADLHRHGIYRGTDFFSIKRAF